MYWNGSEDLVKKEVSDWILTLDVLKWENICKKWHQIVIE